MTAPRAAVTADHAAFDAASAVRVLGTIIAHHGLPARAPALAAIESMRSQAVAWVHAELTTLSAMQSGSRHETDGIRASHEQLGYVLPS
ncbi:MAG: hypothetical protein HBSAPP03_01760 [Phycisphaerae bacterium]|nr:MAG: hypothetical protein HBSAPP03_01760 [Phycisphaerae bacterium]